MGDQGWECVGLDSIPAELLHSILASRDSLRCRDLGRLASTCRLFTTAHAIDHIDAAAEAVVAHWSPAAQARLQRQHRPAGSQYRPGQICWLQTLGKLETLVKQFVKHTLVRGLRVKEAETFPALTEALNDVAWNGGMSGVCPYVRIDRTHTEAMVGYTVLQTESVITDFKEEVAQFEMVDHGGRHASAFGFLVRFLRASLCQKEHSLLVPWIEKLDGYGCEVHKLFTQVLYNTQPPGATCSASRECRCRRLTRGVTSRHSRGSAASRRLSSWPGC